METVKVAQMSKIYGGNPSSDHAHIWQRNRIKITLHLSHWIYP